MISSLRRELTGSSMDPFPSPEANTRGPRNNSQPPQGTRGNVVSVTGMSSWNVARLMTGEGRGDDRILEEGESPDRWVPRRVARHLPSSRNAMKIEASA